MEAAVEYPQVSDEAVQAKTGRNWSAWCTLLDAAGADRMPHREIVALVAREPGVSRWWQQAVAVGYERIRGLRRKNQTATGYQVSVSKTLSVPVERLFAAWMQDDLRQQWLPDTSFTVRKATPGRSMRVTWMDGSNVDVLFYSRGDAKAQVSVDHRRLPRAAAVEEIRAYWTDRLNRLKEVLQA